MARTPQDSLWEILHSGSERDPRYIRPYPLKVDTLIRRTRIGGAKTEMLRGVRPPIHRRFARLTGTQVSGSAAEEARAAQDIRGSLEERLVYKALIDNGLMPDVDFSFQSSFQGGRAELGGLVADFIFEVPKTILQVQSYWHTTTLEIMVRDDDQAAMLRGFGYDVVAIWPETIHDPASLSLWIEQNILHLYGASWQPSGWVPAREQAYLDTLFSDFGGAVFLQQWLIDTEEILEAVK